MTCEAIVVIVITLRQMIALPLWHATTRSSRPLRGHPGDRDRVTTTAQPLRHLPQLRRLLVHLGNYVVNGTVNQPGGD